MINQRTSLFMVLAATIVFCGSCIEDRKINIFDPSSANYQPKIVNIERAGVVATAFSETGRSIWSRAFNADVEPTAIADLAQDGIPEALIGLGSGIQDAGFVYVINWNGTDKFKISPPDTNVFFNLLERKRYSAKGIVVDDLYGTGENHIIINWGELTFFASRLSVFDSTGTEQSSYWHPGQISTPTIVDLNEDGYKELLLTGINNDLSKVFADGNAPHFSFVTLLDASDLTGQAPPYSARDIKPISGFWYLVILPRGSNVKIATEDFYPNRDGLEIELNISPGIFWYLDSNAQVLDVGFGDGVDVPNDFFLLKIIGQQVYRIFPDGSEELLQ